jgi:hypothetical protein
VVVLVLKLYLDLLVLLLEAAERVDWYMDPLS